MMVILLLFLLFCYVWMIVEPNIVERVAELARDRDRLRRNWDDLMYVFKRQLVMLIGTFCEIYIQVHNLITWSYMPYSLAYGLFIVAFITLSKTGIWDPGLWFQMPQRVIGFTLYLWMLVDLVLRS